MCLRLTVFNSKALAYTVGGLVFDSITTKMNTERVNRKIRNFSLESDSQCLSNGCVVLAL